MQYYSVIIILTVLAMLVMLGQLGTSDIIEGNVRRGFRITFLLIIVTALMEWAGVMLDGTPDVFCIPHAIVKAVELSLTPLIMVMWVYILGGWDRAKYAVPAVIIHGVLEVISLFGGWIFYIADGNIYTHGPLYVLYYIAWVGAVIFLFFEIYRFSTRYQVKNSFNLILIAVFLMVGISFHIIRSAIRVDWLAAAMAFMMFYSFYMELALKMDSTTGLMNRRSYESRLASLKKDETVVMFDVDDFKIVNDVFGHKSGDEALKLVADCIMGIYGKRGLCYRIGGDEFAVVMKKGQAETAISPEEEASIPEDYKLEGFQESTPVLRHMNFCFDERIRELRKTKEFMPDVSLGYYRAGEDMTAADTAAMADALMYANKRRRKAKKAGK